MYSVPADLRYTSQHEWARLENDGRVRVGITDFAQQNLGDITFLELAEPGTAVQAGQPMGEIESPKVASDIYSPVTGRCAEVNRPVMDDPEIVNRDPYGEGWMILAEDVDRQTYEALLSPDEYRGQIDELG
jgi:glycine cleavage system H protein